MTLGVAGVILASRSYGGGRHCVCENRLGRVTSSDRITRRRRRRRRWTDAAVLEELRVQSAELGHFPTRSDLVAGGLRGLWDAMRSSGGVDAWRERVREETSVPSREDIAVRAYELYAQGVPGDAEAHWVASEQQLRSDAGS